MMRGFPKFERFCVADYEKSILTGSKNFILNQFSIGLYFFKYAVKYLSVGEIQKIYDWIYDKCGTRAGE